MTLDGCGKFIKYSIFIVNFLIFVLGLAILGIGIWTIVDGADLSKVVADNTYKSSSIILLIIGGVVAFISFLGCCGAIKEVKCMLLTFFIVLLLICILVVAGVVLGYKFKNKGEEVLLNGLKETIGETKQDENLLQSWNNLQEHLHCCGASGYGDWPGELPVGCVCTAGVDCAMEPTPHWNRTCFDAIKNEIKKLTTPLMAIGITIMVIIVLAMVFSCALFLML